MEAAFGVDRPGRGETWNGQAGNGRRRGGGAKKRRRAEPQQDELGPLWLVDAATVHSLPNPSGPVDIVARSPKSAICGNCREWVPPPDPHASARGRCLHLASGISHPPAEFEGCPFFA